MFAKLLLLPYNVEKETGATNTILRSPTISHSTFEPLFPLKPNRFGSSESGLTYPLLSPRAPKKLSLPQPHSFPSSL